MDPWIAAAAAARHVQARRAAAVHEFNGTKENDNNHRTSFLFAQLYVGRFVIYKGTDLLDIMRD